MCVDGSTETLWESGEEDRGVVRWLTVTCVPQARLTVRCVCVHVDNTRDIAVSHLHPIIVCLCFF